MKKILRFADAKPFWFGVAVLVLWMLLVSILSLLAGVLFSLPIADLKIQAVGTLTATLLLLFGAVRIGWIDGMDMFKPGSPAAWGVTLMVAIYVLLVNFYAFFGEITFQPASLFTPEAQPLLLQALRAGWVEETVFRGIMLYGLVRVLGRSKRGLVAALVFQAVLFGILHALQAFFGVDPASALSNVLATLIFGLWVGALVVCTGSVWPAILLHAVSNSFILIKGLSSQWVLPTYLGYLRGALFELPLVFLGLWYLFKHRPDARQVSEALSDAMTST